MDSRPIAIQPQAEPQLRSGFEISARTALWLSVLTLLTLIVNGYHPFAEDAGIYAAGVRLELNPALYAFSAAFIRPYLHLSVFYLWNTLLIRGLHLSLEWVFFATQIATTWMLLYAVWQIARRCFSSAPAQWGAVVLFALCLPVPVAGTSLYLMDPYVTSRSITMPITLLAISTTLDRRWLSTLLLLSAAILFHPLMSIYGAAFILLLAAVQAHSWRMVAALSAGALVLGAAIQLFQQSVVESTAYRAAIISRYYCFIPMWHWYEWIGLAAPLILAAGYMQWKRYDFVRIDVILVTAASLLAVLAITVSLIYARENGHSHLIARLQTLRSFLLVYDCMFLILGGVLGELLLKRVVWRWALLICLLSATLYTTQRAIYPASSQIEWPWARPANPWTEAFLWIRDHTPQSAVIATHANYIQRDGEDAQGMRAISQRSSLADFSKDGGTAAIFPNLAEQWMSQHLADSDLSLHSDTERRHQLAAYPVTWVLLLANATTDFPCPYRNARVKVCQLR